jgi:hypothetical protein
VVFVGIGLVMAGLFATGLALHRRSGIDDLAVPAAG